MRRSDKAHYAPVSFASNHVALCKRLFPTSITLDTPLLALTLQYISTVTTTIFAGLLYSVGEGRAYQLGLTSALQCGVRDAASGAIAAVKAAAYAAQRVPKQVLPSGTLRFGKDVHCVQAAAGAIPCLYNSHIASVLLVVVCLH
jgi:hypothetical protein